MSRGIYKITNTINGKCYIGQSTNIEKRWKDHKRCKQTYPIYNAFRKYGLSSFTFDILIECSAERLNYYEQACIAEYNSFGDEGYNLNEGGSSNRGYKHSEETKKRMSELKIGKSLSEEHKAKLSSAGMNRVISEETKEKMSAWQVGKTKSTSHLLKYHIGTETSDEVKDKISKSVKRSKTKVV